MFDRTHAEFIAIWYTIVTQCSKCAGIAILCVLAFTNEPNEKEKKTHKVLLLGLLLLFMRLFASKMDAFTARCRSGGYYSLVGSLLPELWNIIVRVSVFVGVYYENVWL